MFKNSFLQNFSRTRDKKKHYQNRSFTWVRDEKLWIYFVIELSFIAFYYY